MNDQAKSEKGPNILLEAKGIVKVFGSGEGQVKPLKGIDLKLRAGELTLLTLDRKQGKRQ